ncbi:MAG: 1-(5-phosphoribosyl)-5-((5-phosphoribosylamino)methylideneamino)imidazole-4-carboxamide isomerase, partial [Candidatus Latescibacteria bacterium]|nr:1-(5-phosphoribosyl)-5-((5-phosphoribosylamino)methylideneamino)imidazole-4-carboxamide isomerase [Candidatus Latescibacterota bacterium]
MIGPNTEATKRLAQKSGLKVILSGGICCGEDIIRVAQLERFGIEGVIVGKALYEGEVTLREAIQAVC